MSDECDRDDEPDAPSMIPSVQFWRERAFQAEAALAAARKQIHDERDAHGTVIREAYRDLWEAATGEKDTGGCHTAYVEGLSRWRQSNLAQQAQGAAREAVLVSALEALYDKATDSWAINDTDPDDAVPLAIVKARAALRDLPAESRGWLAVVEAARTLAATFDVEDKANDERAAFCALPVSKLPDTYTKIEARLQQFGSRIDSARALVVGEAAKVAAAVRALSSPPPAPTSASQGGTTCPGCPGCGTGDCPEPEDYHAAP